MSGPGAGPPGGRPAGRPGVDPWRWVAGSAVVLVLALVAVVRSGGREERRAAGDGATGRPELVRLERGWPVMGTLLRVRAAAPDSAAAGRALEAARAAVFRVDSLMSTYRPGSDLSGVNRAAGSGRRVPVAAATGRVLEAALAWARLSGGAFDPTAGPLADAWGFHEGEPSRPPPGRADSAARLVGWRLVELDPAGPRVGLPREGMRLDFGAIAKGYALDRALAAMRAAGARGGTADLGGNVSAFGPAPGGRDRWRLGIRHPRERERLAGTLTVDSGSVATSGDTEQYFVEDGVRYSHIMDPRTGRPARGVAQVTVLARRGIDADALATALFVLGPERGRSLLERPAVRRRAPGATAAWILDPGSEGAFGREEVVCAGPSAGRIVLWIGTGSGSTDESPGAEEAADGTAPAGSLPGGCRRAPPPGPRERRARRPGR